MTTTRWMVLAGAGLVVCAVGEIVLALRNRREGKSTALAFSTAIICALALVAVVRWLMTH